METEVKSATRERAKQHTSTKNSRSARPKAKASQQARGCQTSVITQDLQGVRENVRVGVDERDHSADERSVASLLIEGEGIDELAQELRTAIDSGQLFIVYQPLVGLNDGAVTGAEAFVRWQHPQRGIVPPDAFIPLAEVCGLGSAIDAFVINEALRQLAEWSKPVEGWEDFSSWDNFMISVNISSQGLRDPQTSDGIKAALCEYGIKPSQLCLEITATALIGAGDVSQVVGTLSKLGVHLAFDAFVTSSAFMSSRQFRADTIKIDRDFVTGLSGEAQDREAVESVIEMAHALGMTVIGEGIETGSDLTEFEDLDCDRGQGYWLSPPLTPDIFLDRHRREAR